MKLSELIGYLNILTQENINPDYDLAMRKFRVIEHVIVNHAIQLDSTSTDLKEAIDNVQQSVDQVNQVVSTLKEKIIKLIEEMETDQFEKNEKWYQHEALTMSNDYILNHKQLNIDDATNALLRANLKNLTDWRLPGMIIRPGQDTFIEDLVPMDPLYLVDHNLELLQPAVLKFPVQYQRRLRTYAVDDYENESPLWQLPDNQFGLIFVWNYFHYKPLSVVRRYLTDIYQKLRPGGVCIFTYNDCDYEYEVQSAEQNFMCYTPGRFVRTHAESVGFEILLEHRTSITWIKIKRPGEIKSIRHGQALAKILAH